MSEQLVEHLFRHEYGPLVASLIKRVGPQQLAAIEDAVQFAMAQALEFWVRQAPPAKPAAWLYTVAYRKLLSELRNSKNRNELLAVQHGLIHSDSAFDNEEPLEGEMTDALLRMLFVACNEEVPEESQLVFTLKSLCGFSVNEIAQRLFITEANVYKRFSRARQHLEKHFTPLHELTDNDIANRLPMVHQVLYLVFTEGYFCSHNESAIRKDLCDEAIRLTFLLSESTLGNLPETHALLALMFLNRSRISARQNDLGDLLLLEEQDRKLWDRRFIAAGLHALQQAAQGNNVSRFHIEASIAAEHCLAPNIEQTHWDNIISSYTLLEKITTSALIRLNKAIAIAQSGKPEAGLSELESLALPGWLERSYHWYAVKADLLFRCNEYDTATNAAHTAIKLAPKDDIKKLLRKRFDKYSHE